MDIKTLNKLADEHFDTVAKIAELEADLAAAKRRQKELEENEIPEAMEDLELDELKTKSGLEVTLKRDVYVGQLTHENVRGLEWLRSIDQGGAIKTMVGVPFAKGEESEADELVQQLLGEGIVAAKSCSVHPQTLRSILRKLLEEGAEIPDFIGAHQVTKANVKPSK